MRVGRLAAAGALVLALASLMPPQAARADVLTVTTTSDGGPGSLRQAIADANGRPGQDTIAFDLPGSGVRLIPLESPLPPITDALTIDGYTQPGSHPNTLADGNDKVILVELDGSTATGGAGLTVLAGGSTVRGLAINRFKGSGLLLEGGGSNLIEGNFIGIDAATGARHRGNNIFGILVEGSDGNTIGGTAPAARNVMSGNGNSGIGFRAGSSGNVVLGNFVGTNAAGTAPLGNDFPGIAVEDEAGGNTIGGTAPGARNVISGNLGHGILLMGTGGSNVVRGNFIGTDPTGSVALGNDAFGLSVENSDGNTIGGAAEGDRNLISGNGRAGLRISAGSGTTVQGNLIGTDLSGASPLGNREAGIRLGGFGNLVGGEAPGAGNTIAFNGGDGIWLNPEAGAGNRMLQNSIHSNMDLGIDLGANGVDGNDAGDADAGPNDLQNFPVLASAYTAGGLTNVKGTIASTPNSAFRIEFFTDPSCDPSGYGEAAGYLGAADLSTDASGGAAFSVTFTAVPVGEFIASTATNAADSTSELSECTVSAGPEGRLQLSAYGYSVGEGSGSTEITVTREIGTSGTVTVDYATVDGSAMSGADYTATSGTLAFADGETSKSFSVPIRQDTSYEGKESLEVFLANPTGGAAVGRPSRVLLEIADDDPRPATVRPRRRGTPGGDDDDSGSPQTTAVKSAVKGKGAPKGPSGPAASPPPAPIAAPQLPPGLAEDALEAAPPRAPARRGLSIPVLAALIASLAAAGARYGMWVFRRIRPRRVG